MGSLIDTLGHDAVATLATIAGGRHLDIPAKHHDSTALSRLIGAHLAAKLVAELGGNRVYIPRGPSPHNGRGKAIDLATVEKLTAKRWSAQRIADTLDCTPRTIYAKRALLKAQRA